MKTPLRNPSPHAITLATLALGFSFILAGQAASWYPGAPLITERSEHTATLLASGMVLVAGGATNGSAELYDPATGRSVATGALNVARQGHTAALLPNGKVLVVGGWNGHATDYTNNWLASAELYDPLTGTWTITGSLHTPRVGHTMTLLPTGKVLVAAGSYLLGGSLNSAELYDPASGTWTVTGPLRNNRVSHTATLLLNGKVLVAAGIRGTYPTAELASAELYDPVTGLWSFTGSMNFAREYHTATLLADGTVLAAGGDSFTGGIVRSSTELYDPASGSWTVACSLNIARHYHTATLLPNGKVLVIGGQDTNHNQLASTELYGPADETWATSATMYVARYDHAATLLADERLLVTGGYADGRATNSTEVFDYLSVPLPIPTTLTGARQLGDGSFQFMFTNTPGASFGVLATTNLTLPLDNWTALDGVTELYAGQFQFADAEATNSPQRFYRLRSR